MKTAIILSAAMATCIGLFGCSSDNQDTATDQQQTESTQQAPETAQSVPAEYTSALNQAKIYLQTAPFSYQGLYDQLVSEYGGQFPAEAAQYAVDNCGADWNEEALEAAESYQKDMSMSHDAIYDQLISEYGNKFTQEQAQYAIDHLPA